MQDFPLLSIEEGWQVRRVWLGRNVVFLSVFLQKKKKRLYAVMTHCDAFTCNIHGLSSVNYHCCNPSIQDDYDSEGHFEEQEEQEYVLRFHLLPKHWPLVSWHLPFGPWPIPLYGTATFSVPTSYRVVLESVACDYFLVLYKQCCFFSVCEDIQWHIHPNNLPSCPGNKLLQRETLSLWERKTVIVKVSPLEQTNVSCVKEGNIDTTYLTMA